MLCRHASLADSLLSAWVITSGRRMNPRYVLEEGTARRPVPRHRRQPAAQPLPRSRVARLVGRARCAARPRGGPRTTTRSRSSSPRAPGRHRRSGASASRRSANATRSGPHGWRRCSTCCHRARPGRRRCSTGCPTADVVIAWHVGFDGLDTFGGILRHLARRPRPVQFHARRIARADVPSGDGLHRWLDDEWLLSDRAVHHLLNPKGPHERSSPPR